MDNLIKVCEEYVKKETINENTGHDYYHALRVYKMATYLSIGKDVNEKVIALASLLHDLDDYKVASPNSKKVEFFLNQHVDEETKIKVMEIVNNMSYSDYLKGKKVDSLEGKIVQDADRLDALGAIGIARVFAYSGKKNRHIYDYSFDDTSAIAHFYQKLLGLDSLMNFPESRLIAEERIAYMKEFLRQFFKEF
ncbi:MAG: HD domain-containing protein [Candidatus Izemoplasmatales bacterium]|nr:HD domain-containing protein [Candidatus Izemoplasmatales bacterium]